MESQLAEMCSAQNLNHKNIKETESAANFQKFIYDLFEKNGILNDLRAYLRGHIVNVLRSAQTGDAPTCQKHFTQRLEPMFQALNVLIAEYLLRLDFSYTLSVFVSEIPLANMLFDFAKSLLHDNLDADSNQLRFKDGDVWSVLNYLGVQCDSEHALNVIRTYKSEDGPPLLLCILKCMPMYTREPSHIQKANSSEESLPSSAKSSDTPEEKTGNKACDGYYNEKCKHYAFCKTCQGRMARIKDKYKRKRMSLTKNIKETNMISKIDVKTFMKNISIMERSLIDEMFQQLKGVYEAEMEMVREEEEKKIKRSLASHVLQLQNRRDEMEKSFKARQDELESNIQQKKQFLWGLARTLRTQHGQMERAMLAVRRETNRLTVKEDSLKEQLVEAERVLKERGEEMRNQISNELIILEGHLESMKRERDVINRERLELEQLRSICDTNTKVLKNQDKETDDKLCSHYELLKNEITILKKYLETTKLEPKCVIDRSTLTELSDVTSKLSVMLNNEQDADRNFQRSEEDRANFKGPNLLVNELKKQKNVNFSQANLDEIYRERSRDRSRSSASSEAGEHVDLERDMMLLREDNERLRTFARQQRDHIDELSSQQARLQAELAALRCTANDGAAPFAWRPRTVPAVAPRHGYLGQSMSINTSASANAFGWRKGAGEDLSVFSGAQPRILVPGDVIPFVGAQERRTDNRRQLINQWRALRRRISSVSGKIKSKTPPKVTREKPSKAGTSACMQPECSHYDYEHTDLYVVTGTSEQTDGQNSEDVEETNLQYIQKHSKSITLEGNKKREKSPKTVLKEAKDKLKNSSLKVQPRSTKRENSPSSVLKEAKLRLRKLEIEAEAVERSYLDFRKRQAEFGAENFVTVDEDLVFSNNVKLDVKHSRSLHKCDDVYRSEMGTHTQHLKEAQKSIKKDFDKYLRDYQTKYDTSQIYFKNKNTTNEVIKPIPKGYSDINKQGPISDKQNNYLETPITEFRKLYHSQISPIRKIEILQKQKCETKITTNETSFRDSAENSEKKVSKSLNDVIRQVKNNKAELEILKNNISKIYNLPEQSIKETKDCQVFEKIEIENDIEAKLIETNNEDSDKNLLRIEVENVTVADNVKINESHDDLVLVVESSVDNREIQMSETDINNEKISTQMTIIVSPKQYSEHETDNKSLEKHKRSESPEQAAQLTRNDVLDAIFHNDIKKEVSSVEMQLEISNEVLEDSIDEKDGDDFSADVDNYNSHSDEENVNSPISLPKTSEDENFWDS